MKRGLLILLTGWMMLLVTSVGAAEVPNEEENYIPTPLLTAYATPPIADTAERMENAKRILIIVDYQHDFVDGVFGNENAQAIDENIYCKVKEYQENGDLVIYTMDSHPEENYLLTREGMRSKPHCIPGTPGWEVYGKTAGLLTPDQAIMVKKGCYGSSQLVNMLAFIRSQGITIESIEMGGVSSSVCVFHNAILVYNFFPETKLMVNRNISAAKSMETHDAVMEQLENFGIVISE